MSIPDREALTDLLGVLRKAGVTKFRNGDLQIELGVEPEAPPRDTSRQRAANEHVPQSRPENPYDHPSLWPGGKRPSFTP